MWTHGYDVTLHRHIGIGRSLAEDLTQSGHKRFPGQIGEHRRARHGFFEVSNRK
jgi:hypothetical protein